MTATEPPATARLAASILAEAPPARTAPGHDRDGGHEAPVEPEGPQRSLRDVLSVGGWSTAMVLFGLNVVDEFDRVALQVLGPDIQETFGFSDAVLGLINGIGSLLVFAAAIPLGVLADRSRRTRLLGVTSVLWAAAALAGGLVRSTFQLLVVRIVNGIGKGNGPVHASMLADQYPPDGRGRIFALHGSANAVGNIIAPALAGILAAIGSGQEGWRLAFIAMAFPALLLAVAAFRLPEPVRGRWEQDRSDAVPEVALAAPDPSDADVAASLDDDMRVSLSAGFARLKKIRSFYLLMAGLGVLGFAIAGAPPIFNLLLEEEFGLSALERGAVGSVLAIGSGIGAVVGGRYTDRLMGRSPGQVLRLIGAALALFGLAYPLAISFGSVVPMVAVLAVAYALVAAPVVSANAVIAAVAPYRLRGLAFAMVGVYLFFVGGLIGGVITGMLSEAYGERTALLLIVPPSCIAGGLVVASAGRFVRRDIELAEADLVEEREERRLRAERAAAGESATILQVRGLDYSYGTVQVLFDVDLDLHEGEVLALLGTNGAGKSTVLRAISGLGYPDRGTVRLEGRNITFLPPEERVRLGIVQVSGGKAVFPSLSVAENLLVGAYSFVWDTDRVDARAEEVLQLFPRLRERLDQPAGTLSGGEQQMLAIAKALLLEPRVLIIDELSLGLAPVIVQELLEIVDRLKSEGLTILIVEQSVNVALHLADRAIFMEKGEVRFEGRGGELLERGDLLRAVFLGGEGG